MSKYLKTPDDVLTSNILFKSLDSYLLNEHVPGIQFPMYPEYGYITDNGEEAIQKILHNSKNQLRMYGSAKEIAENLKIFREFPFSLKFFKLDDEPFFSSAVVYESLKGGKFLSNMDILTILQNMALKIFPNTDSINIRMAIIKPLRSHDIKNVNSLKFLKFDEKIFDEIENEMREAAKCCHISESEFSLIDRQFAAGNFVDFVRKLHPVSKTDETKLIGLIKQCYKNMGPYDRRKQLSLFTNLTTVSNCLKTIIGKRPNIFLGNGVSFVRLFEDGSNQFVMKSELFHAISKGDGRRFKEEDHLFTTISMEEVERIYGNRVKNIEFIRTSIAMAMHKPTLVKGHFPGELGTLVTDYLINFFRFLIIAQKFFQKISNPNWKLFSDSFEDWFDKYYKLECKTPYFIRCGLNFPLHFETDNSLNPKEIRNAKIDGFTIQNLKNELVHLGLNRVFPEIGDHAESVYSAVDQIKKGQYLRTCDLFDAVFYCQLICLLDKVPKFKTFLHNQSGCGRVLGYNCEMCQKKKSEIQKSLELSSNESKGIESSENMKKEDTKMISFKEYEEMKMKILELEKENRELKDDKSRSSIRIDNVKMDKLSIDSSIPTVSTNNIISECLICELELKTTGDTLKCPMCRTRFHSKCAMEYAKYGVQCPSCKGTLQNSMAPSKLF